MRYRSYTCIFRSQAGTNASTRVYSPEEAKILVHEFSRDPYWVSVELAADDLAEMTVERRDLPVSDEEIEEMWERINN